MAADGVVGRGNGGYGFLWCLLKKRGEKGRGVCAGFGEEGRRRYTRGWRLKL